MSARWATTAVFFVNGAVVGTWVAQIPWIRDRFDLSTGEVGLVLTGMSLAVILTMPLAGQAIARYGSVRIVWVGGIACALALNLPVLAPHALLVVVALFVLGMTGASMDVAMNAHGVQVERRGGKPIMSSLHAGWSFGGMVGSGGAALLAAAGLDARVAVAIASAALLATLVSCASRIGEGSTVEQERVPAFALPPRAVVLLAVLCLL